MERIPFRHSLTSRLLLAIIAFPTILTLGGFFIFQQTEYKRIVEFSKLKVRQLEHFNSALLLSNLDSFKEKALRIASDNQIIVPFKLKVHFQLQAYLDQLFDQNQLVSLSLLSPDGVFDMTVGRPIGSYLSDFSDMFDKAKTGQPSSFYVRRKGQTAGDLVCLAAVSPVLSGTTVIAVLLIAKDVVLDTPFTQSLLVSGGRIQSVSVESSFLVPLVDEVTRHQEFGLLPLSVDSVIVSKLSFPYLKESDSYLLCGIEERAALDQNRKIISYGVIISIAILLCLSGYSFYLSRRLTGPLLHIVKVADRISANQDDFEWLPERKDEVGALNGSLQVMTTKLQNTINELRIAKREAEEGQQAIIANKAKSEFLANMSHELRTPLNHIIGFTELVLDKAFGGLTEPQEEYLTDVLHSSRHLLSLINDILDLSKIEAGKMGLRLSTVDLRGLLESSLVMIKEKALNHRIGLTLDLDHLPDSITADERMLKQIMYNLLSNAAKFTPDGGKIRLQAGLVDSAIVGGSGWEGRHPIDSGAMSHKQDLTQKVVRISVADSGIGIQKKDLCRIFDTFEQVDNSASRKYQGTGLGLSLTKSLVELHGGKIWAESEGEGKGSTFVVLIPGSLEERPTHEAG